MKLLKLFTWKHAPPPMAVVKDYFVVLQEKAGPVPGFRTWRNFGTKAEFENACNNEAWLADYEVVEEGVATADLAMDMCESALKIEHSVHSFLSRAKLAAENAVLLDEMNDQHVLM